MLGSKPSPVNSAVSEEAAEPEVAEEVESGVLPELEPAPQAARLTASTPASRAEISFFMGKSSC